MTDGTGQVRRGRRADGDAGAALVEFAFVAVLLLTLVFGIISFGLILSFKQDMTRAAAEGARAGAVAVPIAGQTYEDAAETAANTATDEAVQGIGGSFGSGVGCAHPGISSCDVAVDPCLEDASHQCVTVDLVFDYGDHPLYGDIPLMSAFLPDTVEASSVARINE